MSRVKEIYIPEGKVSSITKEGNKTFFINGSLNYMPLSINQDGSIYNDGLGYKQGYRVRSGGVEIAEASCSCIGFLKATSGDVITVRKCDFKSSKTAGNAVNVYDNNFTNLGQMCANADSGYGILSKVSGGSCNSIITNSDGSYSWVIPFVEGYEIAYIRVNCYIEDGSNICITINEG